MGGCGREMGSNGSSLAARLRILLLTCLALVVALALASCGGDDSDESSGSTTSTEEQADNPAVTAEVKSKADVVNDKVAVFFVGSRNNRSLGNSVADGAERATEKLRDVGVEVTVIDNMDQPQQYERQANAFIRRGYKYLFFAHGGVPDVTVKLARQHPDVTICQLATEIEDMPKNVCTVNLIFQNGDFLAGVLAAMVSQNDHIGAIIGPPFPILTSEMEGYVLGARWINPDIEVTQTAIESYTDVAPARAAAEAQIGAGADILLSATDEATQGLFQAAQRSQGALVIPQYFDSYDIAPEVVLTAVLFNLDGITEQMINLGVLGEIESKDYLFGYNDGVGTLAPLREHEDLLDDDDKRRLEAVEEMIASGDLEVPFLGEVGDALKYDLSQLPEPPQ